MSACASLLGVHVCPLLGVPPPLLQCAWAPVLDVRLRCTAQRRTWARSSATSSTLAPGLTEACAPVLSSWFRACGTPEEDVGSFECYFFNPASRACHDVAIRGFLEGTRSGGVKVLKRADLLRMNLWAFRSLLGSSERFLVVSAEAFRYHPDRLFGMSA